MNILDYIAKEIRAHLVTVYDSASGLPKIFGNLKKARIGFFRRAYTTGSTNMDVSNMFYGMCRGTDNVTEDDANTIIVTVNATMEVIMVLKTT